MLSESDVWKVFGLVVDENDVDLDYAGCCNCYAVFKCCGRQTDTSTLRKHKCYVSSFLKIFRHLLHEFINLYF